MAHQQGGEPPSLLRAERAAPGEIGCGSQPASPGWRVRWRDLAIGLSLANLTYFRVWSEMFDITRAGLYDLKSPGAAGFLACVVNTTVLGTGLALLTAIARRREQMWKVAEFAFLAFLLLPLNAVRSVAIQILPLTRTQLTDRFGPLVVYGAAGLLMLTAAFVLSRWRRQVAHGAASALLIVSPFALVNVGHVAWKSITFDRAAFRDNPLQPPLVNAHRSPRVLWIIWDSWDYRLMFIDRIAGLSTPEIDRFRRQALFASDARPPGGLTTVAIPQLLMGRRLKAAVGLGPDDLLLTPVGPTKPYPLSSERTIFDAVRQAGFNAAVVGFHHPYGRVFNRSLTACWWDDGAWQANSMGETFWQILPNQTRSLFETDFWSAFGQSLADQKHARTCQESLRAAKRLATDSEIGFFFCHFAPPHFPHAYDRYTGQFTLGSPRDGYWHSLALVNRMLGELRREMEKAGTWDSTAILMSADHPNLLSYHLDGKGDPRVPFLLKLSGQQAGLEYQRRFNTVVSHDLVLAILRGEVRDAQAAAAWLDRHGSGGRAAENPE